MTRHDRIKAAVAAAAVAASVAAPSIAHAFVSASVGGHPGEVDMNTHLTFELGKIEPTERPSSFQKADIRILNLGAGYTFGDLGPLKDFYARVEGNYYVSSSEDIGATEAPDGRPFHFYDQDKGAFATALLAFNVVHEGRFSWGFNLQGQVPIEMDLAKFSNPHIHYVGGGTTVGIHLTPPAETVSVGSLSRVFVGSGTFAADVNQNASIAMTQLFALTFRDILPWKFGVSTGTYFEGDLTEHVDPVYNTYYERFFDLEGDRVRAMRFALVFLPYFRITDNAALELGYVQKLFGYDPPATQFWSVGLRSQF